MPTNRGGWLQLTRIVGPPESGALPRRGRYSSRRSGGPTSDTRRRQRVPGLAAAAMVTVLYILLLAPLLGFGIDNIGIAAVFSTDEALSGRIVRSMVDHLTLNPDHFFAYGALYHEVAALPLMPFAWLGMGDRAMLLSLRAVALVSAGATLLLTAWLGARLYGWWTGALAAALLATSPELARWSITAHPDTLQLALITGGLIAVVAVRDRPTAARLSGAAVLAGLAFGTKYGGLLLLPLIVLAALCALIEENQRGSHLLRRILPHLALILVVFTVTFAVTNPYAAVEWRRFLTQFEADIQHARAGHVFAGTTGWWSWVEIVASSNGVGAVTFVAALAGWAVLVRERTRVWRGAEPGSWQRLAAALDGRALVALWSTGYLAYLIAFIGLHEPRYALPALPGLAVSAAAFVVHALRRASRPAVVAGGVLVFVLVLAPAIGPWRTVYATRVDQRVDRDNPRIAAGMWLSDHVDADSTILADAYVYVPPPFSQRTETFGLTAEQTNAVRPVVIVTNEDIRGRFRDGNLAGQYVDGVDAFRRRADAYESLESGEFGCYRLQVDLGSVRIYADETALRIGSGHGCGAET